MIRIHYLLDEGDCFFSLVILVKRLIWIDSFFFFFFFAIVNKHTCFAPLRTMNERNSLGSILRCSFSSASLEHSYERQNPFPIFFSCDSMRFWLPVFGSTGLDASSFSDIFERFNSFMSYSTDEVPLKSLLLCTWFQSTAWVENSSFSWSF